MEDLVRLQTQTMQQLTQAIALMQQNLQNPPVQPPPQPIRDKRGEFLKGRPPKFSRAKDPMEAEDWIKAVERQLDIAQLVGEAFEFADDPVPEEQEQQQFAEEGKYNTDHPCYLYTD
nr:unnamed protein product [Digitaria exilis]